jgi:hypothetical protein
MSGDVLMTQTSAMPRSRGEPCSADRVLVSKFQILVERNSHQGTHRTRVTTRVVATPSSSYSAGHEGELIDMTWDYRTSSGCDEATGKGCLCFLRARGSDADKVDVLVNRGEHG